MATPSATAPINVNLDNVTLRVLVDVAIAHRLQASDDPAARITVSAQLEITPSGVRILALSLTEPDPIDLAIMAGQELLRASAGLLRLFSEMKPDANDGRAVEKLRRLFDALGRIAAAVARASVFVADVAAEAAHLIAEGLAGLAEMVGQLLRAIGSLLASAANTAGHSLAFEIRIATDPFEIRQVLVTLRRGTDTSAGTLTLRRDWIPSRSRRAGSQDCCSSSALRPVHSSSSPSNRPKPTPLLAVLSTDLWLKQNSDQPTQPMRDADGGSGDRSVKRLLAVTVSANDPAKTFVLLVAGVQGSNGIFFQSAAEVAPSPVGSVPGVTLVSSPGRLEYHAITEADFKVDVACEMNRVLPLLGIGEPGKENPGSFLAQLQQSLAQTRLGQEQQARQQIPARLRHYAWRQSRWCRERGDPSPQAQSRNAAV